MPLLIGKEWFSDITVNWLHLKPTLQNKGSSGFLTVDTNHMLSQMSNCSRNNSLHCLPTGTEIASQFFLVWHVGISFHIGSWAMENKRSVRSNWMPMAGLHFWSTLHPYQEVKKLNTFMSVLWRKDNFELWTCVEQCGNIGKWVVNLRFWKNIYISRKILLIYFVEIHQKDCFYNCPNFTFFFSFFSKQQRYILSLD